jgi:hypothetical protein
VDEAAAAGSAVDTEDADFAVGSVADSAVEEGDSEEGAVDSADALVVVAATEADSEEGAVDLRVAVKAALRFCHLQNLSPPFPP